MPVLEHFSKLANISGTDICKVHLLRIYEFKLNSCCYPIHSRFPKGSCRLTDKGRFIGLTCMNLLVKSFFGSIIVAGHVLRHWKPKEKAARIPTIYCMSETYEISWWAAFLRDSLLGKIAFLSFLIMDIEINEDSSSRKCHYQINI